MSIANSKWTKLLTGAVKFLPEAPWVAIVVELVSQMASQMGATSGDSKESLKHIEALHAELTQVNAAHSGLAQQLSAQSEAFARHSSGVDAKLDSLSTELGHTKLATASIGQRLGAVEAAQRRSSLLLHVLCFGMATVVVLLIVVLVRQH